MSYPCPARSVYVYASLPKVPALLPCQDSRLISAKLQGAALVLALLHRGSTGCWHLSKAKLANQGLEIACLDHAQQRLFKTQLLNLIG